MMQALVDATTMHEFNAMCLTPVENLSPREIKSLRLREKVSQGVFALISKHKCLYCAAMGTG